MAGVQTLLKIIINKLLITMKQGYLTFDGPVTRIPDYAFQSSQLTSIHLPDSVTSIGNNAFSFCHSLTSIIIPDNLLSLGTECFSECLGLITIDLSNTQIVELRRFCFSRCGLTSITLPDCVVSLGSGCFSECWGLITIDLSNTQIVELYSDCFYNCSFLESIKLSNNTQIIGSNAFGLCANLKSIYLPDSVSILSAKSFLACKSLKSITLPDNINYIGEYAFDNSGITEIIYKGITYKNIHKLTQVLLDNHVTIFENTFARMKLDCTIEPNNEATIITTINYTTLDEQPVNMENSIDGWGYETKLIGNEYK